MRNATGVPVFLQGHAAARMRKDVVTLMAVQEGADAPDHNKNKTGQAYRERCFGEGAC